MSAIRRMRKKGYRTYLYFPTEKMLRSQGIKGQELARLTRELKKWTTKEVNFYIKGENVYDNGKDWQHEDFIPPYNISDDDSFFENVVISQWYATLAEFSNGEAYNLLRTWMGNTVRTEGKHNTAIMLQDGAENGHLLTWEVVYKHDNAVLYIGYMLDYLPDEGVLYKEEMLDKIEYMKRLGDALEQDEDWEYPL